MEPIYPKGPASVPENLTKASPSYRKHAWLAVFGLILFVVVYFALAAWFSWGAYQIILETSQGLRKPLLGYLVGGCSAFLSIFMIKALFFVKHSDEINDLEVTAKTEPKLFSFLHKLADEAGAPRPYRVFLSARVNACVFYDLSILNFFFSSKKNLEIGLPLVNTLTLGELKAVLAHEFGHFAQKTMAVGRWVYIAQQIAGHIIAKRDFLDKSLNFISGIDLRIAWIGWVMRLIVWSLRAVMDSIFSIVVIAQRALSREMEFQADLVAVSLTGSDALVHALYKLQAADDAWDRTLQFVNSEVTEKRGVNDLFAVQTKITEKMQKILDDPNYGKVQQLPKDSVEEHRVFKDQIVQPPKMWATHPENNEREENAKRIYITAPIDENSSWKVFEDAEKIKQQVSTDLLKDIECQQQELGDTYKSLDKYYSYAFLNPNYKGAYLGRNLTQHAEDANLLFDESSQESAETLLTKIYPHELKKDLKKLRELQEEYESLRSLRDGALKVSGSVIKHNGKEYKRKELQSLIDAHKESIHQAETLVIEHDKLCRTAHLQAAKLMGDSWSEYLIGLINVLHYSEHTLAEVNDVRGLLNNVLAVVFADGNVSSRELSRVIQTGVQVCQVLESAYKTASQLELDKSLLKRLKIESWSEAVEEFTLPNPDKNNINDWIQAIDSWFDTISNILSSLRTEALEQLLITETYIGHKYKQDNKPVMEYGISKVPAEYTRLLSGNERKLQKKLGLWDRFQTADGVLGAFLRFAVAGGIIGTVFWSSFKIIVLNQNLL